MVFCAKQVEWDLLSHSSVKSAKRSQRPPPQVYSKMTALLPVICKTLLLWFMNNIHQFPHDTLLPLTQLHWIDSNESFGEVESFYLCQLYNKTVVSQTHRNTTLPGRPWWHTFPITPCRLQREQLLRTPSKRAKLITLNELCACNTQQCMQGKKRHRDTSSVQFNTVCWSLSMNLDDRV